MQGQGQQLKQRLDALADDIGRLRRHTNGSEYAEHLVDRLACHCETIYCLITPSAGEIALCTFPHDEETITLAIEHVDAEWQKLQHRLRRAA